MNVPCEFFLFSASVQALLETSSTWSLPGRPQDHAMPSDAHELALSATSKYMDC